MREVEAIVWTVGHSTHLYERFLELLRDEGITAIADVRTAPYSRHFPQFNKEVLKNALRIDGIAYSFLGDELGGRPKEIRYYCDGVADYAQMAKDSSFRRGIQRVLEGALKFRIALMCSEHDPLDCHRCLLVGRALAEQGAYVKHIHSDGQVADHRQVEERLLRLEGQQEDDLFMSHDERLAVAYRKRASKVAYAEQADDPSGPVAAEYWMDKVDVATIGFTKIGAEDFFERLLHVGVRKVVDVRLHNTSQLAGFAKAGDLAYFLKRIGGIQYVHQPMLAPTDSMLKAYKKEKGDWVVYKGSFLELMAERKIEQRLKPEMLEGACLLCSEATPHHCHRRLVVEYLNEKWGNVLEVNHI